MNWGPSRWEGTNAMGDQWDGGPMEWAVCGCQLGDQWDRGPVRMRWGTIGIGRNWVDEWKGGPICSWRLMNWGTNEKGTNELGDQWDGGPMSRGDQWDGGPMEWVMHGCQLGDQWDGRLMSWGTNEMGNQWDGGPMRWGTIGIGGWWGDEWKGGPMRWGTSDMGDQWAPIMYWGTNELGNQWEGDQWDGGPMRRIPYHLPWANIIWWSPHTNLITLCMCRSWLVTFKQNENDRYPVLVITSSPLNLLHDEAAGISIA